MGVSIDTAPPLSQDELDFRSAAKGGPGFVARIQQLEDARARHDESLAELNLGRTAKAAFDDAQGKQSEVAAKLAEASATLEAAHKDAATAIADANKAAEETLAKAKADADALTAEAQRIHGDAQQTKASADAALAATNAERQQLGVEREAARRMAEAAETTRATFQAKTDRLHAVLAEVGAATPAAVAAALAS